jgi:hypothetical protein
MTFPASLRSRKGVTLVELIITATVMSIMILTVVPLFTTTTRGYTSLEVSTVLAAGTQVAVTKIQNRLSENKRLFGNDTIGNAYKDKVTPSLLNTLLAGSKLPVIDPDASLSPSSATFVTGNTGNSLLFASVDEPVPLNGILNGSGVAVNVRLDTYVFNYYYLYQNPSVRMGGTPTLELWEWHSIPYVDYLGLINLSDVTLRNNSITALLAQGYTFAFNSSATATTAFYQMSGSNPWLTLQGGHNLTRNNSKLGGVHSWQNDSRQMIDLIRGISVGGFTYSVSFNTSPSFTHRYTVPVYGTASSDFPSGFETLIVGPSGNRRVFARLVMAAKGSFKGVMSYEQILLAASRDLY